MTMLKTNFKSDFPVHVANKNLSYLDSSATSLPPARVFNAMDEFARKNLGPVHRGVYNLSLKATESYEQARADIAVAVGAGKSEEIIFTRGATASLNLAAHLLKYELSEGDEILLTVAEHHSNLLPWQRLAEQTGAELKWLELTADLDFPLKSLEHKLTDKTKIIALPHISNVLGFVAPLKEIVELAHVNKSKVVVDAAQCGAHLPRNLAELGVDYAAFSSHKLYGPPGLGWLFAKQEHWQDKEPFEVGGGAIAEVGRDFVSWHPGVARFEAGTPNVIAAVGAAEALKFMIEIGLDNMLSHEKLLVEYARQVLGQVSGIKLYSPAGEQAGVISFSMTAGRQELHPHDIAFIAAENNVAVRGGHHCAQVLMKSLDVPGLTRASFGLYTTREDIDKLALALQSAYEYLS